MKWVKLANLGDIVLFLGSLCSFSASASALDLCVPKGNCVIIMDNIFSNAPCVFLDLDDGRLLPLIDYAEYFELFVPPQKWIK
ncbi:hypothetical protein MtrunA17_Chr1g0146361 [Medicago truncatula]|uniref:KIB1-4 beta-propeller domain-containing protein n=1 Tax=Medicago truncatula TaxID=3880 RepID=A0A396JEI0_MEDTR|nr:hypothetical protein MtrunA17_Chr1g0146361 [Medicago truncatula]